MTTLLMAWTKRVSDRLCECRELQFRFCAPICSHRHHACRLYDGALRARVSVWLRQRIETVDVALKATSPGPTLRTCATYSARVDFGVGSATKDSSRRTRRRRPAVVL